MNIWGILLAIVFSMRLGIIITHHYDGETLFYDFLVTILGPLLTAAYFHYLVMGG